MCAIHSQSMNKLSAKSKWVQLGNLEESDVMIDAAVINGDVSVEMRLEGRLTSVNSDNYTHTMKTQRE
jgi:hypothetical protein